MDTTKQRTPVMKSRALRAIPGAPKKPINKGVKTSPLRRDTRAIKMALWPQGGKFSGNFKSMVNNITMPDSSIINVTQRSIKPTRYVKNKKRSHISNAQSVDVGVTSRRLKQEDVLDSLSDLPVPEMNPFNVPVNISLDNETLENIEGLRDLLRNPIQVNHAVDQDLLNTINGLAEKIGNPNVSLNLGVSGINYKVVGVAGSLLATALYHYNDRTTKSLTMFIMAALTAVSVSDIVSMPGFAGLIKVMATYISRFNQTSPQMNDGLFETIVSTVTMLFVFALTKNVQDANFARTGGTNWVKDIVSHVFSFKRHMESVDSALRAVTSIAEKIISFVTRDIFGGESVSFFSTNNEEIDQLLTGIRRISDLAHLGKLTMSPENARLVHDLWLKSQELIRKLPKGTEQGTVLALNNAGAWILGLKKKMDGLNLSFNGMRIEPAAVLFVGPPGTGKSQMLYPLAYYILSRVLPADRMADFRANPNNFVFNRQAECVYWDGYDTDKWICFIDDLGQLRDVAGQPDNEWMNFIRMVSCFNYVLHTAALEKKGNVYFDSRFVIANTNLKQFNVESIVELEAFERRIDRMYICVPKPEFCTPETSQGSLWGRRLDKTKLPIGPLGVSEMTTDNSEFWEAHTMGPQKGTTTGKVLNFEEIGQEMILIHEIKKKRFAQTQLNLDKIFEDARNEGIANTEELPTSQMNFTNAGYLHEPIVYEVMTMIAELDVQVKGDFLYRILSWHYNNFGYDVDIHEVVARLLRLFGVDIFKDANCYNNLIRKLEETDLCFTDEQLDSVCSSIRAGNHLPIVERLLGLKERFIGYFERCSNYLVRNKNVIIKSLLEMSDVLVLLSVVLIGTGIGRYVYEKFSRVAELFVPEMYSGKKQNESKRKSKKAVNLKTMKSKYTFNNDSTELAVQMSCKYDNANFDIIDKIMRRNCYEIWLPDQDHKTGVATFIRGRVFAIPKHFCNKIFDIIEEYPQYEERRVLFKKANSKVTFEIPMREMLNIVSGTDLESLDMVFVKAPKYVMNHADITKYFLTRADVANKREWKFRLALPGCDEITSWMGEASIISSETIAGDQHYILSKGFKYAAMTKEGDCGSIFSVLDTYSGQRKVCGFHVAGHKANAVGISNCVVYEDVIKGLEETKEIIEYFEEDAIPQAGDVILDNKFTPLYHHHLTAANSSRTKVIKSQLYGSWGPSKMAPAKLGPFELNGETIDPYLNALKEYNTPFVYIDPKVTEHIGDAIYDNLCHKSKISVERKVYSFYQAISGIEGEPEFGPISRSTSAGFPHNSIKGRKLKGKGDFFGTEGEVDFSSEKCHELQKTCLEIVQSALNYERKTHIFTDVLKDERRKLDKVANGKTRLFSAGPLELLILFRQYFGAFILWCQKNRINNGFAVGVNPYSHEWQLLANELLKFGTIDTKNIGAGDFRAYDAKEKQAIQVDIVRLINTWYDDEYTVVRDVLWLEVMNSKHIRGDLVYEWVSGNCSGNPVTTLVNNLYNHYVAIYAWYYSHGCDLSCIYAFYKHVVYIVFGDDNIFSVSNEKLDKFNESVMEQYSPLVGQEYTNETKTECSTEMRSIKEVTFLKRGFRKCDTLDRVVAPLDIDVILEIPYWTKLCDAPTVISQDNVDLSLRELALHGKETFKKFSKQIVSASVDKLNYHPPCTNWTSTLMSLEGRDDFY